MFCPVFIFSLALSDTSCVRHVHIQSPSQPKMFNPHELADSWRFSRQLSESNCRLLLSASVRNIERTSGSAASLLAKDGHEVIMRAPLIRADVMLVVHSSND